MDPVRVIHFADLHLGVEAGGRPSPRTGLNQRVEDVLARLDELVECAENEGVHAVVFAGDAFKNQHPTPTLQMLFAQRVRRLARAGVGVFLLVGNHDLPKMAALAHPFSIYDALEVDRVVVGERPQVYTLPLGRDAPVPALQVAALPHFSRAEFLTRVQRLTREQVDELINEKVGLAVQRLAAAADPALPSVFAGHCHVNKAELTAAQNLFGVSELEVLLSTLTAGPAFPYYALGHIHNRQVLSADPFVAYPGSLERTDFGEGETVHVSAEGRVRLRPAQPKGFYRFDLVAEGSGWRLAGEPAFREVSARRFCTIRLDVTTGGDVTAEALEALAGAREAGASLTDALVKIVVRLDAADRARLRHRELVDALSDAYDARVVIEVTEQATVVRDPRFAVRMSDMEALERYLDTRPDWADDRDELLRLARELVEEISG